MKYQSNNCVCGAEHSEIAFPVADWNFSNVTETGLMRRCSACGSLFPEDFPDDDYISEAYSLYYTASRHRNLFGRAGHAVLEKLQGMMVTRNLPQGALRVLDFGCGSGAWLASLKVLRPELDLAGTDIIRPTVEPLAFRWIPPTELSQEKGSFDWITLSHVLEHLPDPLETMTSLVECLAPGGSIWIATPNAQSYLFSSLKGRARDADFPRHRQIFSRNALTQLLQDCGLQTEFHVPPRINSVLNLKSCLASRNRLPLVVAPPVSAARPIADTLRHLLQGDAHRKKVSPEHMLIARRPIHDKVASIEV